MPPPGFTIAGPAGRIEGLIREPESEPRFAAVVCHPHPLYGGTMHNKVVYRVADALAAAGGTAMRFNFRGAGLSSGHHDEGRGETDDLKAVLDHLVQAFPDLPLLIAGFSFGAYVGLRHGASDGRVEALIGVGLAVSMHDFTELDMCTKPKLLVQGSDDEFGSREQIEALVDRLLPPKELVVVDGADHLFGSGTREIEAAVERFAGGLFGSL